MNGPWMGGNQGATGGCASGRQLAWPTGGCASGRPLAWPSAAGVAERGGRSRARLARARGQGACRVTGGEGGLPEEREPCRERAELAVLGGAERGPAGALQGVGDV